MGAGGQVTACEALDPDVPDTGQGAERERARAARASPSARGTCDLQRVTQPLPPVACSLGGPDLRRDIAAATNQPTNPSGSLGMLRALTLRLPGLSRVAGGGACRLRLCRPAPPPWLGPAGRS